MHCEKCNVDFSEGLRYCKWCGESLVEPPRVTSELHTCPSCAAAVQPTWAYCKSCGERLQGAAREPAGPACTRCGERISPGATNCTRCGQALTDRAAARAQDSIDTSLIAMCSSCGERLDTGSLYCKACGSAAYQQPVPFGGSALLCGACNSFSPFGSRACRVCGTPFPQTQQTVVDRPIPAPPAQQKPNTLPDLDEHLPASSAQPAEQRGIESGANTLIFTSPADEATVTSRNRTSVDTNMLPGTAGSRSEQQAPTSIMQMGRTTGPVEDEADSSAPVHDEPVSEPPNQPRDLGAEGSPFVARSPGSDQTLEFPARLDQPQSPKPSTFGLGAEQANLAGSENKTEAFASRPQETPGPAPPEDQIRTREFVPPARPQHLEPTREIPAVQAAADVHPTRQMSSWPAGSTPVGVTSTQEYGQPEGFAEGVSQPLPQPAAKGKGSFIASIVVVIMIVGAAAFVAWWFLFARAKPAPKPVATVEQPPAPPVATAPEKPPAPVIPEGMLMVSAGTYVIGRDDGDPIEQPQHRVEVSAFLIDRTEVTNAAYKKFVDATGHKPPTNWTGAEYPEGRGEAPVTGVTWQDAADYARWAGKRLPTESEWEAAARGLDGRIYPWGSDWRSGVANIGVKPDKPTAEQYPSSLKEVGGYPQGASPCGAVDMIGNAWEWVADEIKPYPGNTESSLELEPGVTYRVIRGGAYDGNKVHDATYRGYLDGSVAYPKVGFRCVKDPK